MIRFQNLKMDMPQEFRDALDSCLRDSLPTVQAMVEGGACHLDQITLIVGAQYGKHFSILLLGTEEERLNTATAMLDKGLNPPKDEREHVLRVLTTAVTQPHSGSVRFAGVYESNRDYGAVS